MLHVYYASDADQLPESAQQEIRNKILEIGSYRIQEIYVEGHTDSDASSEYNIDLSKRRAGNATDYLLKQGVPRKLIKDEAFGESKPLSDKKALNRCVQITFIYELDLTPEDFKRPKVIIGITYDAKTKEPLPTQFVIEVAGTNQLKRTSKRGFFRITGTGENDLAIIFSRDGYLNKELIMEGAQMAMSKDTIKLKVYLQPVKVLDKITFENIYFFTDSDQFRPESKDDLLKLLKMMRDHPDLYIEIQGHMNFPATRKATKMQQMYNYNLSHKRAKAVYQYLVDNGIDRKRLTYKGMSNFRMVYPIPKTAEQEDMNKRVEVWTLSIDDLTTSNKP